MVFCLRAEFIDIVEEEFAWASRPDAERDDANHLSSLRVHGRLAIGCVLRVLLARVRAASAFVCVFRYADDGGREGFVAHVNSALV